MREADCGDGYDDFQSRWLRRNGLQRCVGLSNPTTAATVTGMSDTGGVPVSPKGDLHAALSPARSAEPIAVAEGATAGGGGGGGSCSPSAPRSSDLDFLHLECCRTGPLTAAAASACFDWLYLPEPEAEVQIVAGEADSSSAAVGRWMGGSSSEHMGLIGVRSSGAELRRQLEQVQRQLGDGPSSQPPSAATPLRRASLAVRPILLPPSKAALDAAAAQQAEDGGQQASKPLTAKDMEKDIEAVQQEMTAALERRRKYLTYAVAVAEATDELREAQLAWTAAAQQQQPQQPGASTDTDAASRLMKARVAHAKSAVSYKRHQVRSLAVVYRRRVALSTR
jgi:hypothetical protein